MLKTNFDELLTAIHSKNRISHCRTLINFENKRIKELEDIQDGDTIKATIKIRKLKKVFLYKFELERKNDFITMKIYKIDKSEKE